jgi:hypothetical protein
MVQRRSEEGMILKNVYLVGADPKDGHSVEKFFKKLKVRDDEKV